jgi:hypothetical protein
LGENVPKRENSILGLTLNEGIEELFWAAGIYPLLKDFFQ